MLSYNDITVGMVNFNRSHLVKETLPSYSSFKNIFVWDNNSELHYRIILEACARKNKNVTLIFSNQNVGWPEALNQLIIRSTTDWVLLTAEDMMLGEGFIETVNKLLEWKPNLEQIYVHTFDTMLFHKRTIARLGWWDEGQPAVPNFWEDNDWYLRLVEYLGYSPYVYPGDHITGEEREKRLKRASTREIMEKQDNISYFSNCRWGISSINFDIREITRDHSYIAKYNKNKGESAEQYYLRKWEETGNPSDLLLKDGTFWKRKQPDKVFYPEILSGYRVRYL